MSQGTFHIEDGSLLYKFADADGSPRVEYLADEVELTPVMLGQRRLRMDYHSESASYWEEEQITEEVLELSKSFVRHSGYEVRNADADE